MKKNIFRPNRQSDQAKSTMSEHEKKLYRMRFRYDTYQKVRTLFERLERENGLSQKLIADRLGVDPSLVSRRLNGEGNLTMDTLCDLARAMGARLEANVVPLDEVQPKTPHQADTWTSSLPDQMGVAIWKLSNGKLEAFLKISATANTPCAVVIDGNNTVSQVTSLRNLLQSSHETFNLVPVKSRLETLCAV